MPDADWTAGLIAECQQHPRQAARIIMALVDRLGGEVKLRDFEVEYADRRGIQLLRLADPADGLIFRRPPLPADQLTWPKSDA